MPATIIGNSQWTSRGLVLTAQDAQEQVNGLVNVQVTYVGPASRHDEISRSFYLDAQPPIFPTVVSPSELVTNRLYMVSRSVSRANGLTTVTAQYAGGLQRAGFRGYFLSESIEKGKKGQAFNYFDGTQLYQSIGFGSFTVSAPLTVTPNGTTRTTGAGSSFLYDERVKIVEFMRVNKQSSVVLPTFFRADLASIVGAQENILWRRWLGDLARLPEDAASSDLWVVDGPEEIKGFGQLSFEKETPVGFTESSSYVTPTVEIVTLTYRLSR
jgi:hypothetical protein